MKIGLINVLNYRKDGKEGYQQDFDCKVPGAWRESHWENRFCTVYTKDGVPIDTRDWDEAKVHSDDDWDLPDDEWMRTGRNHHVDPSWPMRVWKKEVEVFGWYVEMDTLEAFMAFVEQWSCTYEDAFCGRFAEEAP